MKWIKRLAHIDEMEPWQISYADMVTLLLAFFVVIITATQIHRGRLEILSEYFASSQAKAERISLPELFEKLAAIVEEYKIAGTIQIRLTGSGVELEVGEKLLFDLGKAELREESKPVLTSIAKILSHPQVRGRKLIVEGHTDALPINTLLFASNWELSSARACQVVRFFVDNGISKERLEARGFADTKPAFKEIGGQGQPKNRRVHILIY